MPGSLGGLVVSLGLNAVEFTTGLTKAEREAQKFAAAIDKGIATAASAAGVALAAIGTAAAAAFAAVDKFAKEAAQFQDLSEKTGASAESLASFAVAANVAGTSMESIAGASIKLTKNLTGVDDESKAAGAALKALGLNIQQFKALSPDKQIEAIAKALANFEDGAGKTAVAIALFGKAGADALPFLKELAEGVGRVNILTDEQIKRADAYADAQARTRATLQAYAQAISAEALPAINAFIGAAGDAAKELLGLTDAAGNFKVNEVRKWAEDAAIALAHLVDVGQGVITVIQLVNEISRRSKVLDMFGLEDQRKSLATLGADLDKILQKSQFSALVIKRINDQRAAEAATAIGPPAPRRKALDFEGAQAKAGRAQAERTSEAERFLESLKRQLETTEKLTAEETALNAIQSGRLKGLTPDIEARILATAREIDGIKALEEARKAHEKAVADEAAEIKKANDERERAIKSAQSSLASAEAGNQSIREEIAILVGGEDARKAIERHHIDMAIAIKDQLLGQRELNGASKEETDIIRAEISTLEKRKELLDSRDFAEAMKRDAEQLQQFKNIFADTFADAFASFIDGSKSASDAFKAFAKSVEQQITRLAAQNIANAIFGGTTGGGFDLSKIFQSIFGAIGGGSFGGAGGGGGFGTLASGTDFWRGGPTVVGESGPEVVNLPRGATVTSNQDSQKMFGPSMNFVINVLPGASTKTAQQAAAMTGIQVQRALARNT